MGLDLSWLQSCAPVSFNGTNSIKKQINWMQLSIEIKFTLEDYESMFYVLCLELKETVFEGHKS